MTFVIKPDDLAEVEIRRLQNEIHICVQAGINTYVFVIPNGDILGEIAEALIHHHLAPRAYSLESPF